MKKIAIPTKDNQVDNHFGHCDYYTIYEIKDNKIVNESNFEAPRGCGCKSGVGKLLSDQGVTVLLAGGIGRGAVEKLTESNIVVITGCNGAIETVITQYLAGVIIDSGELCTSNHEDGHECSHS